MKRFYSQNKITPTTDSKDTLLISGSAAWLQFNITTDENSSITNFAEGLEQFNRYINDMIQSGFNIKFLIGANANGALDDIKFIEYMEEVHSTDWQVYKATSVNDWLSNIEKATLLVSGRFHHTIAASCLGTPFICFSSNTPKMDGLAQLLNYSNIVRYDDYDVYNKLTQLTDSTIQTDNTQDLLDELCLLAENNFDGLEL